MVMRTDDLHPFVKYDGLDSSFQGSPPLAESIGYAVVLGFSLPISGITTILVCLNRYFGEKGEITIEYFNTAGRMVKTGLTASVIVS